MPKWTSEQLSAINTTDRAVIVSAAAGSGKTAVLIERTIRLLCDEKNKVPCEKLLAVTFTNDAASQMREKLSNALNERIELDPTNEWLQQQQMKLQMAKIATINSFCFDLVKNNVDKLDISNGVRILDETESKGLIANALEETMENNYSKNPQMMKRLNELFCNGDDSKLCDIVLQLYQFSRSLPFKDTWFKNVLDNFDEQNGKSGVWGKIISQDIKEAFSLIYNNISECYKIASKLQYFTKTKEIITSDLEIANDIQSYLKNDDLLKLGNNLKDIKWKRFYAKADKNAPDACEIEFSSVEYIKSLREKYKKDIKKITELITYNDIDIKQDLATSKQALEDLLVIINDLESRIWEVKLEKNAIDFSDVEILSIKLLTQETENGFVRSELAQSIVNDNQYKIILIDEFQDVNNLQDIIFKVLSNTDDCSIIGKNMFVVGDVKQSIYRFRQANPNIFIETQKQASKPSNNEIITEIKLKKNFRSRKNVVDFVNFVFKCVMSEKVGQIEYTNDEALQLGANFNTPNMDTEILMVNPEEKDEYTITANRIKQLIDEKVSVTSDGITRPCRQSDFCILLRSRTHLKEYVEALKNAGLKSMTEELSGYLRSREISILISMLTILDNPMNDIAMASVLLSPLFMFTDNDLVDLRMIKDGAKLYSIMLIVIKENNADIYPKELILKCKKAVDIIKTLRFYASGYSLQRLIRKIYDTTDFMSVVSAYKDGKQMRANLRLLLEYANSYDNSIAGGLSGFIRYINVIFKSGGDFKQAGTVTSSSDAVIIKTIHKSKGLEFPFVFLCSSSTEFTVAKRDLSKQMIINLYTGVGFRFKDNKTLASYTTLPYDAVKISNRIEMLSEEMRLLYVALTRAKEKIFITFNDKESIQKRIRQLALDISREGAVLPSLVKEANSMQEWITMALLMYSGSNYLREKYASDLTLLDMPMPSDIKFSHTDAIYTEKSQKVNNEKSNFDIDNNIVDNIKHYINYSYDDKLAKMEAKLTVSEIAKKDTTLDYFYQIPRLDIDERKLTAAEKGTATHNFMQFADYEKANLSVKDEIDRLVDRGHLSKKQGEAVDMDTVKAFFDGDLYSRLKNSKNVMREKQFEVMISDLDIDIEQLVQYNGTDGMLQGIADCIFEENDGHVLIDYKTDNVKTIDELKEHYTNQLLLYKKSFDLILDKPIKSCYIYSFKLGCGIEIDF